MLNLFKSLTHWFYANTPLNEDLPFNRNQINSLRNATKELKKVSNNSPGVTIDAKLVNFLNKLYTSIIGQCNSSLQIYIRIYPTIAEATSLVLIKGVKKTHKKVDSNNKITNLNNNQFNNPNSNDPNNFWGYFLIIFFLLIFSPFSPVLNFISPAAYNFIHSLDMRWYFYPILMWSVSLSLFFLLDTVLYIFFSFRIIAIPTNLPNFIINWMKELNDKSKVEDKGITLQWKLRILVVSWFFALTNIALVYMFVTF